MKKILLSCLAASTLLVAAHAEDMKVTPLVTHTEFGYIQTDGNTKTKTFNLEANAKKAWGKHEGEFHFDGQYADDDGVETKNKYLIELNYNYSFTKRLAFDYLVGYKSDKFSGYDYQFYTGPGANYKAIVSEQHNLILSGNILYSQDQQMDIHYADAAKTIVVPYPYETAVVATTPGEKNDYAAYRLKGEYEYKITKTLKFNQDLSIRGDFDESSNYFVFSKTALSSKISDIFSAGISYKVDYANKPPQDKKGTDTTLTLNLIMDY
jgi:putative salt-induced outer membrane protein